MKIAILGAGFAGLAAAFELTKNGFDVTIFEKEAYPGGLASGFQQSNWEWPLERAYHHLFTSDWHARNLLAEIGMEEKLFFKRPITASLYPRREPQNLRSSHLPERRSGDGEKEMNREGIAEQVNFRGDQSMKSNTIALYQLDSPLSLLHFPRLSPMDRMRAGAVLAYLKITPYWKDFEKTTAKEWLTHMMGKNVWKVLWEPLIVGKFGSYSETVNMAWFWARIKKRSSSLGYIEGGFQSFAEGMARKVQKNGGKIYYSATVNTAEYKNKEWKVTCTTEKGKQHIQIFSTVLSTLPTPIFTKVIAQLPKDYSAKLHSIAHLHALNLILEFKEPFLPPPRPYWLNICDPTWPFLAVVEHTNFVDPKHYGSSHLVYIGNYLPREHEYFKKSKEELFDIYKPYLAKINPQTINLQLTTNNSYRFVGPFAQPVVGVNYSHIRPPLTTPLPNLYMANLDSVYPWDRGTNYAIELGQNAAKKIMVY